MNKISKVVSAQKQFFLTQRTKDVDFRKHQLERLYEGIQGKEREILRALQEDLNKSEHEAYTTEIGVVLQEIRFALRHILSWTKAKKVKAPLTHLGSKSVIYSEPRGVVLIFSPWNYPFQLAVTPLIGAIAAGNCVVIKPSERAPHVAKVLSYLIEGCFSEEFVTVVRGGAANEALLSEPFDHIFFTGSPAIGKVIMQAASKRLIPVTLELGGKSPAIVCSDAKLDLVARRLVWGKFTNAGQTCVAPDYLCVHRSVKDELLRQLEHTIKKFYGLDPLSSEHYAKIGSKSHFKRLASLLDGVSPYVGGQVDEQRQKIAPTIVDATWSHKIMEEEIFGPILPVLSFHSLSEVVDQINRRPKPLALYLFSEDKADQAEVIRSISFGGGCINDTLIHLASPYLPFGGIGESGMGNYHGYYSFRCFSHEKAVVKQTTRLDLPFRYPHVTWGLKIIKKFMS